VPTSHPFPYLEAAARRYGVDAVQVVNPRGTTFHRNKFIDGLTVDAHAALVTVSLLLAVAVGVLSVRG
jgi:hypothetical protein